MKSLKVTLEEFSKKKVLVVGDLMLDAYWWGVAQRISPEAPVPVLALESESERLGGAANVALNLVGLGATTSICAVTGTDENAEIINRMLSEKGICNEFVIRDPSRPTTVKRRILASNQQLLRVDTETVNPISAELRDLVFSSLTERLSGFDCVVVSDYAKGFISTELVRLLVDSGKPVMADPKGVDYGKYRGCSVITPNLKEFQTAVAAFQIDEGDLIGDAVALLERIGVDNVLVTRGAEGMTMVSKTGEAIHRDASARKVYDVTGAGDTVIAALSLALSSGIAPQDALELANEAAGIVVESVGTTAVDRSALLNRIGGSN